MAGFLPRSLWVGVALLASLPPLATAQHSAAPAEAKLDEAEVRSGIEKLGESPIATVLTELGSDVQTYQQHVTTLASPFFEGRAPGLNGNRVAADYIEFYLRRAGLEPAFASETTGPDDSKVVDPASSYRQPFQSGRDLKVRAQEMAFNVGGDTLVLKPGRDFNLLGGSGSGQLENAPVAFVGYSIDAGTDAYTSYPGDPDLTGKVALIFRFEPMDERGRSKWVEKAWSPASGLNAKLTAAAEKGAAAILLVNPPGADDPRANELMDTRGSIGASRRMTIPIAMITPEAAARLVGAARPKTTLTALRQRADEKGEVLDLGGVGVTVNAEIKHEPVMTDNVAGVLRGRGELKDQYIVIGAHYDHVGYGPIGVMNASNMGKLHPGADDNASGTSGVLMLAEKLAAAYAQAPQDQPLRSVILMCFSAEEGGLNGSRWWVNHPSVPLEQVDLMINMDMIGRLRSGKVDIDGVESAEGFYDLLRPFFEESGLNVKHGFSIPSNSDHYSFYAKKIPILSLFTGYHREYHTPADEAHLINAPGAVQLLELVEKITVAAAERPERLKYKPSRPPEKPEGEAAEGEEGDQQAAANPGPVRVNIRFGIAPGDYSSDEPGVPVGDVFEGTSAADAGIKVGDRLMKWNGKEIKSVEAWMPMLSAHKPGDVVEVTILREGKEIPVKVTLKARSEEKK
jgi:hypothetical protein